MKTSRKKGLIITLSVIFGLFLLLLIAPFAFKNKIKDAVIDELNKNLTAKVELKDISLSFIRNFPNVSITLENLKVIGKDEFVADTLLNAKKVNVVVNIKSFFTDRYEIKRVLADNTNINAHLLPNGEANWNILVPDSLKKEEKKPLKLNLKIDDVRLKNSNLAFNNEKYKFKIIADNLNFSTSGDFTADSSLLKTTLAAEKLTFAINKINYLSNAKIDIKADINANINAMRFELKKNSTKINALQFALVGWLQVLDKGVMDMDLKINSEKIDFKSILSLIPAVYKNSFKELNADGKLQFAAAAKGKMVGDDYPTFNVKLIVENGRMQYAKLPKSLNNINLDLKVDNKTTKLENMIIDLAKLSFDMGGNAFQAKAHIENPLNDMNINAFAKGVIDLGMVKDFYPIDKNINLNGIFNVDLNLAGRMSYYEKNQFDKFTFGGNMSVANLLLKTPDLKNDLAISTAKMQFSNKFVDLSQFSAKIGKNDLTANGKLENFLGYILNNQTLNGELNLYSNYLNANDFNSQNSEKAPAKTDKKTGESSVIEIPKNMNFNINAKIKELIYEKMNFSNAGGNLKVENGVLIFKNLALNGLGGSLLLNGNYNSADIKKPTANLDINVSNISFTQVFSQIETMKNLAPIFEYLNGNFSTKMNIKTALKEDMMPDLTTITANGSITTQSVGIKDLPALTILQQNLQKIPTLNAPNLSNTTLKNLALNFNIKDGKIKTEPFDIKIGDVKLNLGGTSGFDKTLSWKGTAALPNKIQVGKLQNVVFEIGGTFQKPTVKLNLQETFGAAIDDAKEQVTQKIEDTKTQVNDEIQKQREKALQEAQKQVDAIKAQAKAAGDKLVSEAEAQAKKLVDAANNPITKAAAEASGKKLVDEAKKQAAALNAEADKKGNEIMKKASEVNVKI